MPQRMPNRYQYETSPRKLEPDYTPVRKSIPKKSTAIKKATNKKANIKSVKRSQRKTVAYILIGFAVFFAISYRSSQIDENFARVQNLRSQIAEIERESAQHEIAIASGTNLQTIEQQARELLGMQALNSNQIVYVNLPQTDHIEPAAEVIITSNGSLFSRIIDNITNIFN